jgi:hypothetical protein
MKNMNFDDFKATLDNQQPPKGISNLLQALWHDARGDWETAHNISQDDDTNNGLWIHAYLHRKEGDIGNASYWYARAGKKKPFVSLEEEWEIIVRGLLKL